MSTRIHVVVTGRLAQDVQTVPAIEVFLASAGLEDVAVETFPVEYCDACGGRLYEDELGVKTHFCARGWSGPGR